MTGPAVDAGKTTKAIEGESATDVPKLRLRQATVTAISMEILEGYDTVQTTGFLVDLNLADDDTDASLPGVMTLSNYVPRVGDTCWCLTNDTDIIAIDRVSGGPSLFSNVSRVFTEGGGTIQHGDETAIDPDTLNFNTTLGGVGTDAMISESGTWMMGFSALLAPNWTNTLNAESLCAASVTIIKDNEPGNPGYTIAAEPLVSMMIQGADGTQFQATRIFTGWGLNPGLHHFLPKWASTPGISAMKWRELWVIPL